MSDVIRARSSIVYEGSEKVLNGNMNNVVERINQENLG